MKNEQCTFANILKAKRKVVDIVFENLGIEILNSINFAEEDFKAATAILMTPSHILVSLLEVNIVDNVILFTWREVSEESNYDFLNSVCFDVGFLSVVHIVDDVIASVANYSEDIC